MAGMSRERMSSVDTAWLRMDSPGNHMMIVGYWVFEQPMTRAVVSSIIRQRLLRHRRFRQRVQSDAVGSWWVDDRAPDLTYHLRESNLPAPGDDAQMQQLVAAKAGEALDPHHPLWQFELVHHYNGKDALLARVHHCIGDGIALVAVMLSLTDPDALGGRGEPDHGSGEARAQVESNPWRPYIRPITKGTVQAINLTELAWAKSIAVLADPDKLSDYAHVGGQVLKDALRIALMPSDSVTSLKGRPGGIKAVAWNDPLPLDEVKTVSKVLGASINDVLLSCVAGAVRRYLIARGEPVIGCEIRAMVPVNLRPVEQALELGNRFGLVPLELPVGIANPIERLRLIRRRMDELKGGYQALLAFALLGAVGFAPGSLQTAILDVLASKATAVMTNVPGPQQPIYLAGAQVSRVMVWVPQSGSIGMGVSILSYNGGVQFGVITDTRLCGEPQAIVDGFAPEFETLVLMLAMLPPAMFEDPALPPQAFDDALFNIEGRA